MNLFMIFVILLKIGNLYILLISYNFVMLKRFSLEKSRKRLTEFFFPYQKVIQSKSFQSSKHSVQVEWCTRNANKR